MSLEHSTRRLGQAIRFFESEVCSRLIATDLPSEDAPRGRKMQAQPAQGSSIENAQAATAGKRKGKFKTLNLSTYKLHALGHYAAAIRRFGPSDGFSTQGVSVFTCKTLKAYHNDTIHQLGRSRTSTRETTLQEGVEMRFHPRNCQAESAGENSQEDP
jgi:hypothetical protein